MKILALIPARGGSKSIPKKNIVNLNGQPLISYSIKVALNSKYIDKVVVSSDDDEILQVAKEYGAQVIQRPANLAGDFSSIDEAIQHTLGILDKEDNYLPDLIVLLQPTSPLRTVETIDAAIKTFINNGHNFDTLIPLRLTEGKIGKIKDDHYQPLFHQLGKQRQQLEPIYTEVGIVFIFRPQVIKAGKFYGDKVYPFIIENTQETLDIDNYDDLKMAEYFLKNKKA